LPKIPLIWKACLFSFISSFCLMVIELVAGRILAPYIGVSLYTWTSIIGVIMAGIAMGNYLGGKIADRVPSPDVIAIAFILSSLATMAILPALWFVSMGEWFANLPVMWNFTLKITAIFFLPAVFISTVSPVAIRLTLSATDKAGGTVGTVYAFSTAGSILGTFLTGFYFILWFGTRTTVWLIAGLLLISGIAAFVSWPARSGFKLSRGNLCRTGLVIVMLATGGYLYETTKPWQVYYNRESNYYNIRVMEREDGIKMLTLDHLIHSFVKPDDPTYLDYTYLKMFAEIVQYTVPPERAPSLLHLGGGGYSFPRYIEVVYPGSVNDVIEIDPAVTEIAREELGLSPESSILTYNEDARLFLKEGGTGRRYDFIIGDVFNDKSTPYQLTTVEFDRMVKDTLYGDGLYLVNIIDRFEGGKYLPAFIYTLEQVFDHVYLFSPGVSFNSIEAGTFVVAATDRSLDLAAFRNHLEIQGNEFYSLPLNEERLTAYLTERKPILLTDDYVPTDILVGELIK
jgi:spermidine synthase